jgi:hypothetical protein
MADITYSNTDENRFWLQIMSDNARIILYGVPPEQARTRQATALIRQFDELLVKARQNLTPQELDQLNHNALSAAWDMRNFALNILKLQITQNYTILLKPEMFNNMISLADHYIHLLNLFMQNMQPSFNPIDQDTFWLPIFTTQARYIAENVGFFETQYRQRAESLANDFINRFTFSIQLKSISSLIGTKDFPIAAEHRRRLNDLLKEYATLLVDLIILIQKNRLPGSLSLLYLDREYRMVCYYTTKLAVLSDIPKPACDPASLRISDV